MIPMLDLKPQYAALKNEIDAAIADVLHSGQFVMGPNVEQFEAEAAAYLGTKHAISCNSGTDALHLALHAFGIGQNDEVITCAYTFAATAEAICQVGATPVFVDIEKDTFNLSAQAVAAAITDRTRAILPVHLFGQVADMSSLCALAKKHKLNVIEDCAQAFGAQRDHQKTGTFGDAGCFSFFPSKNLGGYGDGGLFCTDSDDLAERFALLKAHGSRVRNQHEIVGWNSRLDELQAAVLRIKLKNIDRFNQNRITAAKKYTQLLDHSAVAPPRFEDNRSHVFHQYTILSASRDCISKRLSQNHIGHAIFYPQPLSQQAAFATRSKATCLDITEEICKQCISLPMFPEISDEQIEQVVNAIHAS